MSFCSGHKYSEHKDIEMSIRSYVNDGKVFIRFVAFSTAKLDGVYKYNDVLQIFSLPDEAPKIEYVWGDHPFVIEYSYDELDLSEVAGSDRKISNVETPPEDEEIRSQYNFSKQDEILSVLSVLTKHALIKDSGSKRWVLCDTEGGLKSEYKGVGYFWSGLIDYSDSFTSTALGGLPMIDSDMYYTTEANAVEPFMLPIDIDQQLNKYYGLDIEKRKAFLSACTLFFQSAHTWHISHSLAYVGLVTSLEALIQYDYREVDVELCKECTQPRYQVTKKFKEFAAKYGADDKEFIKYATKIYSKRSAIGHRGELLASDKQGVVVDLRDEMADMMHLRNLMKIVRYCMVNWLKNA